MFKENRGALDLVDAAVDLGHLQVGIDRVGNSDELVGSFQIEDAVF